MIYWVVSHLEFSESLEGFFSFNVSSISWPSINPAVGAPSFVAFFFSFNDWLGFYFVVSVGSLNGLGELATPFCRSVSPRKRLCSFSFFFVCAETIERDWRSYVIDDLPHLLFHVCWIVMFSGHCRGMLERACINYMEMGLAQIVALPPLDL